MKITLSPRRDEAPLTVERQGDTLTINGETFDFSPLAEGDELPAAAIGSGYFEPNSLITRRNGQIEATLLLPHSPNAPHETRFPEPITLTGDGPVQLPPYDAPPTGARR